ncbi:MAG TPA: DUF2339 domain-containing protein [Pseudonocardiaceae bacterium]|nr:DUF2339 domain-containing protein [Pseudonocardiaceae bacterium]
MTGSGTPEPSLSRLADELTAVGHRLTWIGTELRRVDAATRAYPAAVAAPLAAPLPPPVPRRPGLLEREGAGGRLLAWVGGAVTLLGVLLLLVLAVQRGWLGPLPRVLGGAVLALALIGVGIAVHRRPAGRVGGVVLAATGFAALYLDTVAATVLYGYLTTGVGLVVGLLVAAAGLALADHWQAEPLAVAVVVGAAVLGPVLTGLDPVPLVGFLLVLQVAATPVQLRRDWTALPIVAALPPLLAALALDLTAAIDGVRTGIAVMVPAVTVVALAVALLGSWWARHRNPVAPAPLVVLAGSALPLLVLAPSLRPIPGTLAVTALSAALLALWYVPRWRTDLLPPATGAVAGGLGVLAGFEATALALDDAPWAATLLGEAIVLAGLAAVVRSRAMLGVATAFGVIGWLVALLEVVPPPAVLIFPAGPFVIGAQADVGALVIGAGVGILLAGMALVGPWAAHRLGVLRASTQNAPLWVLAGLGVLYGATASTVAVALLVLPDRTGFLTGHVVVTVSWTVAALVLLARGLRSVPIRAAGLSLVGAAVAKLVLFDLSALDGFARVSAFLGAGLILLAAGTRYTQMIAESSSSPR